MQHQNESYILIYVWSCYKDERICCLFVRLTWVSIFYRFTTVIETEVMISSGSCCSLGSVHATSAPCGLSTSTLQTLHREGDLQIPRCRLASFMPLSLRLRCKEHRTAGQCKIKGLGPKRHSCTAASPCSWATRAPCHTQFIESAF